MSAPLRIRPPSQKGVGGDDESLKPYLDRLLKLIPAEVLSLYLVGIGIIPKDKVVAVIIWGLFCLLAVAVVKGYGTSDAARRVKPDWVHVILSMIAFLIWVYSMGGPFEHFNLYQSYVGSLLVLAFTFVVPYVYRGQPEKVG